MVSNLWNKVEAPREDAALDVLVYRSRLIGADPTLVVWGGGNTSVKTMEPDHLGRMRPVLRIKGSGTDLKTITRGGFPGIFLDEALPLRERAEMSDEEMVAYLGHCLVEPGGARPSIETLLHAFLPARHIDHTHADAIVTLTNTPDGRAVVREALGDRVAWVDWRRPGFALASEVAQLAGAEAVILGNHGLVTWGDTAEESYRRTIDIVARAERWLDNKEVPTKVSKVAVPPENLPELLLRLRGRLGHRLVQIWDSEEYRQLVDRPDVAELAGAGPATADHVLRIRPWLCLLDPHNPEGSVDAWERQYIEWFKQYASPDLDMLSPLPKVFLLPGVGVLTVTDTHKDGKILADVALHTLLVAARGRDAHGAYRALEGRDLFEVEYWPLELYKLTLAPPPRELQGRIVLVTGAASGIGRAIALHLAGLGAQLVLVDLDPIGMQSTAGSIREFFGAECLQFQADVSDEERVHQVVQEIVSTWGGVDVLVSNAGIPAAGALTELMPDLWRRSLEINATSHFLMTAEVMKVMRTQGLGGSLIFIASKNAFGPGAGFGAYSVAKAGQVQLARIAALEGGAAGIRANVINPDAIFEDSKLWTNDVRRERAAAHGVPVEKLEAFYASRTLLKTTVTGHDVAEAVAFLASDRSRATTGTVLTVDGGVASAFPR